MILNRVRKASNLSMQFGRDRHRTQTLESVRQGVSKALKPVAMLHHTLALHIIQHFPHLLRRELMMIQKRDETRDRALEVDIVLPERVVGVDEEILRWQCGVSQQ